MQGTAGAHAQVGAPEFEIVVFDNRFADSNLSGRAVLTCWEPYDRNDERLLVRLRR